MKEILKGIIRQDGVIIVWQGDQAQMKTFVGFEDLIQMKINASDLAMNPNNYLIDPETLSITMVCGLIRK